MAAPTLQELTQSLLAQGLPHPSTAFLTPILTPSSASASQRLPPLPALAATAKHRLLSSDLTHPHLLDAAHTTTLPPGITDAKIPARQLPLDVYVQVLDVEDLGRSKWELIEALEAERKGEMTRGREVVRVVHALDGGGGEGEATGGGTGAGQAGAAKSSGPFKLLLQDAKGARVYGFELKHVDKIGYPRGGNGNGGMSIGCKIMLRKGCKVARGMVLLEPTTVLVLGGKIEALDKNWREGREKALREAVADQRRGGNAGGGDPD